MYSEKDLRRDTRTICALVDRDLIFKWSDGWKIYFNCLERIKKFASTQSESSDYTRKFMNQDVRNDAQEQYEWYYSMMLVLKNSDRRKKYEKLQRP